MNPAAFAVENPRIVVLSTLLLLIYGVLSYQGLPRQENPSLEERFASVKTYLPGAEPAKVEILITKVIEDKVAEVEDIKNIFTTSSHGASFVLVELKKTAPAPERLQQIRDKVQEARTAFPPGASEPDVDTRVIRTNTLVLTVVGDGLPELALREQAKELRRELEDLPT